MHSRPVSIPPNASDSPSTLQNPVWTASLYFTLFWDEDQKAAVLTTLPWEGDGLFLGAAFLPSSVFMYKRSCYGYIPSRPAR
jgi:hypothetical protein